MSERITASAAVEVSQSGPCNLILLDTNRLQARHIKNALTRAQYKVKVFHSGRRLLNWLNSHHVEAVLVNLDDDDRQEKLIARVRHRYPLLPILAIAENTNGQRLEESFRHGANYYIAETSDPTAITQTVSRLLQFRMEHLRYVQVLSYLRTTVTTEIPSQLELLGGMVYYLTEEMFKYGIIGLNQINAKIALVEALTNAMEHGNKLDPAKLVHIKAEFSHDRAVFEIRDEGEGFDFEALPDPTKKENLFRPRGRGVFMMRQFMDEVVFQKPGNCVIMVKNRASEGAPPRPYPWERRMI